MSGSWQNGQAVRSWKELLGSGEGAFLILANRDSPPPRDLLGTRGSALALEGDLLGTRGSARALEGETVASRRQNVGIVAAPQFTIHYS